MEKNKSGGRGTGYVGQRVRVEFCNFPKSGVARTDFLDKVTFGE